jgi:hypothetical protein
MSYILLLVLEHDRSTRDCLSQALTTQGFEVWRLG